MDFIQLGKPRHRISSDLIRQAVKIAFILALVAAAAAVFLDWQAGLMVLAILVMLVASQLRDRAPRMLCIIIGWGVAGVVLGLLFEIYTHAGTAVLVLGAVQVLAFALGRLGLRIRLGRGDVVCPVPSS